MNQLDIEYSENQMQAEHYGYLEPEIDSPIIPLYLSKDEVYEMPENTTYLSECFTDLPDNCILDKGQLGCGGTQLALTNNVNYIIAVPLKEIGNSKLHLDGEPHEILYVKGGVFEDEIHSYLVRNLYRTKKIVVTYDKLKYLTSIVDTTSFKLLIDEFHCLPLIYKFRNQAARSVLDSFKHYNNVVFMSGTVIQDIERTIIELKNARTVTIKWKNIKKKDLILFDCINSLEASIVNKISKHLESNSDSNLYIFVNSVEFISKVISHPSLLEHLNEENCKVVFGENNVRKIRLQKSNVSDLGRTKINFITSTAFEGVDINDNKGETIIAIDNKIEYMNMDIYSTLTQVTGRIRDTTNNQISLFIKFSDKNSITYNEYHFFLKQELIILKDFVKEYNSWPEDKKKQIKPDGFTNNDFIIKDHNGKLMVDENFMPVRLNQFYIANVIFTDIDSFKKSVLLSSHFNFKSIELLEDKNTINSRQEYASSLKNTIYRIKSVLNIDDKFISKQIYGTNKYGKVANDDRKFIEDAELKFPYLWDALKYIGIKKMEQMKFNTQNIKKKLINFQPLNNTRKIQERIELLNIIGKTLPLSEIKKMLKKIYSDLGIQASAKAEDIKAYYSCKEVSKTINNKRVKSITLIERKHVVEK